MHGESLLEGVVEDGVRSYFVEVGEDYRVFFGEGRRCGDRGGGTRAPVEACGDEGDDDHRGRE